eukprot:m.430701 g.430701  ORF g.430701 m.430701 type:complete len:176 (+) comp20240_c9_seq4:1312-1839(+)
MDVSSIVSDIVTSPINVGLVVVIGYLVYQLVKPGHRNAASAAAAAAAVEKKPPLDLPKRDFTLEELRRYDGLTAIEEHHGEKPVYLAVNGTVFDVSTGRAFYGPGGPYEIFAGHDATRGLGTMEFKVSDTWDDLTTMKPQELQTAREWHDKFSVKYPIRGKLVKSHTPTEDKKDA